MKRIVIFLPIIVVAICAGIGIGIDRVFINGDPPPVEVVVAAVVGVMGGIIVCGLLILGWSIYFELTKEE